MTTDPMDALLDRIGELLKLCEKAEREGKTTIPVTAVRVLFTSKSVHPAAGRPAPPKRTTRR